MKHLERALDHQNQWWKYVVMFVSVFVASNLIGAIPLLVVIAIKSAQSGGITPSDNPADFSVYGISQNLGLFLMLISFIVGLLTLILLLKPLHKRTISEVINGTGKVRWNRFFYAFLLWVVAGSLCFIIDYLINPGNFQLQFSLQPFLTLVILAILLIPFQTTYEELLFRGYLSQGLAAWTRNRWVVLVIPALVFGLMHSFNPEIKEYGFWTTMPQYWAFGLLFGLTTILDDGIELAMGMHAANNILSAILVNTKSSVLQTPALFLQEEVNPLRDTAIFILISLVFLFIFYRKYRWNFAVLSKKVTDN